MQESNELPVQSPAPDFNEKLKEAQNTGDFDFVLETSKRSHKMLIDFRDCIARAEYPGKDCPAISMGLNFIENMIQNSAGQISALKQTEKQTREAMKAALKAQKGGPETPPQAPGGTEPGPETPPATEAA